MTKSLVYLRPLRVAYMRAAGPYEKSAPQAWEIMNAWLTHQGLLAARGCRYGLARDNPTVVGAEHCRYDACIPLEPNIDERFAREVGVMTLPGGPYARQRHIGTPEILQHKLSELYSSFNPPPGLSLDDRRPVVSIYLDDIRSRSATGMRVDLCVPLTAASGRMRLGQAA